MTKRYQTGDNRLTIILRNWYYFAPAGFSFKKEKGVPGKAKKKDQKDFIEKYNSLREKGIFERLSLC